MSAANIRLCYCPTNRYEGLISILMESNMNWIEKLRKEAEIKAWQSLARYKFMMFGYWAAKWTDYNRLCPKPLPNPFSELVKKAKEVSNERNK